jgi:hypothetical protein
VTRTDPAPEQVATIMTHFRPGRVSMPTTLGLLVVGITWSAGASMARAQQAAAPPGVSSSYASRAAIFDPYGMAGAYVPPGERVHRQYFADQRLGQVTPSRGGAASRLPASGTTRRPGRRGIAVPSGRGIIGGMSGFGGRGGAALTQALSRSKSGGKYGGARP